MIRLPYPAGTWLAWLSIALASAATPSRALDIQPLDRQALQRAVSAERARAVAPQLPRATFLARAQLRDAQVAPDGRTLAWLQQHDQQLSLWSMPSAGGTPARLLADSALIDYYWSQDSRWLLVRSGQRWLALAAAGQRGSGVLLELGARGRRLVLDVDRSQPAALLLIERPQTRSSDRGEWRLLRVDVHGKQQILHRSPTPIVDAAIAGNGELGYVSIAERGGHSVQGRQADGRWRTVLHCGQVRRCRLLAVTDDGDALLHANADGNFQRLLRLSSDGRLQTLHEDPRAEADLEQVTLDPVTATPLIASYRSTQALNYALDPAIQAPLSRLSQRFPESDLQIQPGGTGEPVWLVHERSSRLRGERLHLYSPPADRLRPVLGQLGFEFAGRTCPRPDEATMARKLAIVWRASDGMRLHGFLHLPAGIDTRQAPLIVSVHGGPFSHERPQFSNEAQFLANRGYVVFQPNFRGSTGYGRAYLLAANGDFGNGRVQQDIVDGVRYLLDQGIGDAHRVAIVGASFGGYSALLGATFQADLFRVAIAAVPPSDLGEVLRDYAASRAEMLAGIPLAESMAQLNLDPNDAGVLQRLRAQSPLHNAQLLRAPVLLLAGGEDERVALRGVTQYAAQLRALNRDVSLFVDDRAGHSPSDPLTAEAYYFLMETLLQAEFGGAPPSAPDAPLQAHLQRHLRLRGHALDKRSQGVESPAHTSAAK